MLDFVDNHKPFSAAFATIVILLTLFGTTKKAGISASEQTQPSTISDDACAGSFSYQKLSIDALQALEQGKVTKSKLTEYDLDAVTGYARDGESLIVARKGTCFLIINSGSRYATVHSGTMKELP